MKLAYFSPLNPQPSGISDYSEELLPHLADAGADIILFVDGFRPDNESLLARFRSFDYRRNPASLDRLAGYDATIYHLGNDHRYHTGIVEVMRKHPGIAVFHDFALQDFFLGLAREQRDLRLYLDEVAACHGERERGRAEEHLRREAVPPQVATPLNFPLNCRLARAAEGIIVHSVWARARFEQLVPGGVPVVHIPMPVRIPAHTDDGDQARDATAMTTATTRPRVQIACFGLITSGKGVEQTLRALAALRDDYDFHYTLVGADNSYFDVRALINSYQMADRVTITGQVSLAEFERRIAETDIAVNLRERTVGETSASLCRIMAAGIPAIVSNVAAFAELPDDAVVKIDSDHTADALLLAYLRRLITDAPLRRRIGANARRCFLAEHNIEQSAAQYLAFINDVIAGRTRRQFLNSISGELSALGLREVDETLARSVATEVVALAPARALEFAARHSGNGSTHTTKAAVSSVSLEESGAYVSSPPSQHALALSLQHAPVSSPLPGGERVPKVEGIDYKHAAVEYLGRLSDERQHHLRTKPFYNLAHKPARYPGAGLDEDAHRHFCDFANMAVALALAPGSRVLDVGCGSGWLSEYFARLGYDVCGIDISPALIEMSSERVARVPYGVDHETSLRCRFDVHDIELAPLAEKFDAIVCYDSLHHFEDERAVIRHLAAMLDIGGQLFILEGQRPPGGSQSEAELRAVMEQYGTLESPFSATYLRELLRDNGLAIVGDYVSINGLFEREMLEGDALPLRTLATDYHYLTCKKVAEGAPASTVPDSRTPGALRAQITFHNAPPARLLAPGAMLDLSLAFENTGDTLWLTGQTVRAGVVMPGVKVMDARGALVTEFHGQPMLPRAVAPGETATLKIEYVVPRSAGWYTIKIDLVNQHICWFEERGSQPFTFEFEVR